MAERPCRPFRELKNEDLLKKLKNSKNSEELRDLQNEFYYRFSGDVFKKAMQICINRRDCKDMAEDVLQNTFIIAVKSINKFQLSPDTPSGEIKYVILGWLGRIANRVYLKYLQKFNIDSNYIENIENIEDFWYDPYEEEDSIEIPDIQVVNIRKIIEALSEKHQEIITTYTIFGCIGTGKHLPDEEMKKLCKKYKTNSTNIRQIKTRTLLKIKTEMLK